MPAPPPFRRAGKLAPAPHHAARLTPSLRRDQWRLGLAAFAVLLAAADTYVVVVALPSIMTGVGVGVDRLQRATPIISGFLLGYTAVLPLIGRLADLAGAGPVLAGCLTAFATGSMVTASSHSLAVVIAGRALQGLGGGGLVPVTLAMVAARWPPDARGLPLGLIGALQELGSLIGPLYGAGIVALASWRAIFWVNVPVAMLIGGGFWLLRDGPTTQPGDRPTTYSRRDVVGMTLAVVGAIALAVGLDAPSRLATNASVGQAWTPMVSGSWAPFTTPIVLGAVGVLTCFVFWEIVAPAPVRRLVDLGRAGAVLARADLPGALALGGILACVVVLFSTADPSKQAVASSAPLLVPVIVVLIGAFWWRQRRARTPLIERGILRSRPVWGALAVNLALGGALMAALVDVPLFARATVDTSSEVAAALVLVRFLIAVPVGAVIGGALCRNRSWAPLIAAIGMALATIAFVVMASWSATALGGGLRWSDIDLVVCGLGFGLAVAPVNLAILGAVQPTMHALVSALAVVARTIGMLAGLSALTALALRRFYEAQARIGSPLTLCPAHPATCPAYDNATTRALLGELHTIFAGAAVCAAVACLLALRLLVRPDVGSVSADDGGTTRWSARLRPID